VVSTTTLLVGSGCCLYSVLNTYL